MESKSMQTLYDIPTVTVAVDQINEACKYILDFTVAKYSMSVASSFLYIATPIASKLPISEKLGKVDIYVNTKIITLKNNYPTISKPTQQIYNEGLVYCSLLYQDSKQRTLDVSSFISQQRDAIIRSNVGSKVIILADGVKVLLEENMIIVRNSVNQIILKIENISIYYVKDNNTFRTLFDMLLEMMKIIKSNVKMADIKLFLSKSSQISINKLQFIRNRVSGVFARKEDNCLLSSIDKKDDKRLNSNEIDEDTSSEDFTFIVEENQKMSTIASKDNSTSSDKKICETNDVQIKNVLNKNEDLPELEKITPAQDKESPVQEKVVSVPEKAASVPVNESPVPVNESPVPVNESPVPVNESPAQDKESPVPEKVVSVQENVVSVPEKESPVPVNESPVPVNESPVPVNESPVPVNESPVPVNEAILSNQINENSLSNGNNENLFKLNDSLQENTKDGLKDLNIKSKKTITSTRSRNKYSQIVNSSTKKKTLLKDNKEDVSDLKEKSKFKNSKRK